MRARCFGAEQPESAFGMRLLEGSEGIPDFQGNLFPVVEAGTTNGFFVEGESEGFDEMEGGAGGEAESARSPCILGYFGFKEDEIEHGRGPGRVEVWEDLGDAKTATRRSPF